MITFSGTKSGKVRAVPISTDLGSTAAQALASAWPVYLGHHLIQASTGENYYQATERAGRTRATAYLR